MARSMKKMPLISAILLACPLATTASRFKKNVVNTKSKPNQPAHSVFHHDIASLSPKDFEVSRDLMETKYPVFQSFVGEMYAGLLPAAFIDEKHEVGDFGAAEDTGAVDSYSSFFFWLFQPDVIGEDTVGSDESFRDDTLVIWFNGGPGCSSMIGNLVENGPVTLPTFRPGIPANENPFTNNLEAPFTPNPYAWTKKSTILYVEQPGGVGFSTASQKWQGEEAEERTEDDVSRDFYAFLQNLFRVFDHDTDGNSRHGDRGALRLREKKLFLAGESYAGMYIPSIARGIYLENEKVKQLMLKDEAASSLLVNLEGVAIGNGWIDAKIQGPTVIDYAFWHGMIDLRTFQSLHQKWDDCIARKIGDASDSPFHQFTTPDECGITMAVMQASGSSNMYDVTTYDTYPVHVDPDGTISRFFNDPDIRTALNVPTLEELPIWQACVPGSGRRRLLESDVGSPNFERELILLAKDRPSVVPYIAELLDDAKIRVLLYNGDLDLACSSQSTEMALDSMAWTGKKQWMDTDTTKWMEWTVDGQVAGHTKKYNNLEFVVVYNSGHFVPTNQARNSLNLIGRMLDGKAFGDVELPQFSSMSDSRKKKTLQSSHSITESVSDRYPTGRSHTETLFVFSLGALISYFVTSRVLLRKKIERAPESPVLFQNYPKTEFTPLNASC